MRLLFVIDNLNTGGAQRQMVNLAVGLQCRNYQIGLFCYAPGDLLAQPLHDAGIAVYRHFKRGRYSASVILALRHLIEKEQYDLVLSFLSTPNFYAIVAGRLLGVHHVPVIASERFCDLARRVSLLERLVRQFYRFAAHVVVNSHHQQINLAVKYPWLSSRLSTIYNGYDLQAFVPPLSEPNNDPLKLLVIASVSPYKNGICLLDALCILRQQYGLVPSVTWIGQRVMFGERLRYLQAMEQKITEYGLEKQWHWLDQRSDIVDQLHQHDVLVHPSYGEGLPNVVCEALACARPVIISDTLDHPRLVQDGTSGYLFNWRDPSDLALKIAMFNDLSTEERTRMGRQGRGFAEEHLSSGRFVNEYERLFQSLVQR